MVRNKILASIVWQAILQLSNQYPTAGTQLGVISYWDPSSADFDRIPNNSLAVINPNNGMFTGQTKLLVSNLNAYQAVTRRMTERNIRVLGYVATGYFNHGCNRTGECQTLPRIEAQIQAYFTNIPFLSGIFFDEVSPVVWNCSAFVQEYRILREIVTKYQPTTATLIAFNAATISSCPVDAAIAEEIVVVSESNLRQYNTRVLQLSRLISHAQRRNVHTWIIVYSVPAANLSLAVTQAKMAKASFFYATDVGGNWQAGENTYGTVPTIWEDELKLFSTTYRKK